jgi:hypothetical protein
MEDGNWDGQGKDGEISWRLNRFLSLIIWEEGYFSAILQVCKSETAFRSDSGIVNCAPQLISEFILYKSKPNGTLRRQFSLFNKLSPFQWFEYHFTTFSVPTSFM